MEDASVLTYYVGRRGGSHVALATTSSPGLQTHWQGLCKSHSPRRSLPRPGPASVFANTRLA